MAYKILGQVSTTAPTTAATIVNLVNDSSFTGFPLTAAQSVASLGPLQAISPLTPWRFSATNSNINLSNPVLAGATTAPFGPTNSSYGVTFGNSNSFFLTQGWAVGQNPDNTPNNSSIDPTTAITVTPSTTYQIGLSLWSSNTGLSFQYRVAWFNSSNGYISQSSVTMNPPTANTWHRLTNTLTTPSNAAFGIISLYFNNSGGPQAFVDGVVFGLNSTYATTFTEPVFPSVAATTSPFDRKVNGYVSETVFSQSGVTFAGDFVTAYTVPAGKEAVVSTLVITNLGSATTTYRVAVIPSGTSLTKNDLMFMDVSITGNSVQTITIGMTLAAGDVVRVAADNALVNATLFGSEN